ncbi:MAG: ATP-binding cassette domain-containing protein, partial [Tenuifilaceae bacterium]
MGKIFEFTSVSAGYDDEIVLKDVNFTVGDNDFVGVIGPNGGGKTTLLKLILGEIKPKRGTIEYFKREPNEVLFGYLPQVIGIDKKFPISVMEVVLSGLLGRKGIMGRYTGHDKRMS